MGIYALAYDERYHADVSKLGLDEIDIRVLSLLERKRSLTEIADSVGLSVEAIKVRRRRMFIKLGVKNRAEAVFVARQKKILDYSEK